MIEAVNNPKIQQILTRPGESDADWKKDLDRLINGDITLDRKTVGENSITAFQRLLIFLGYSTTSAGSFKIDGDFGRGTNRALAQFKYEYGIAEDITRKALCYECTWQTARKNIVAIPDVKLTVPTLEKILEVTLTAIDCGDIMCGSFEEAIFHLNSVHNNKFYKCKEILERYGTLVEQAIKKIEKERNTTLQPEWVLSIIKQETAGVVRPRFEQHLLTRYNKKEPDVDVHELRYRSMSFGLGQILGVNYRTVKAESAKLMFTSPLEEQILFIARFLTSSEKRRNLVKKKNPTEADYRGVARFYNGPGYATHHYHESIERWFKEFKTLM